MSDVIHTEMMPSYNQLPMDADEFNAKFETLEKKIASNLDKDKIDEADRAISYYLEMKYGLQYHILRIPVPRKRYVPKPVLTEVKEEVINASAALKGQREAYFEEAGKYIATRIYAYDRLGAGNIVEGPAIIEAPQTTIVIHPDQKGILDPYGNTIIKSR